MATGRPAGRFRKHMGEDGAPPGKAALAGLNILLVEDETLIAIDVGQLLTNVHCRIVGPCRDVTEALQAIEREPLDCAILDIRLGPEHSLHLADTLASRGIPFIWMSGYDAQILPTQHRDRPFLCKPFMADELFDALTSALASNA